MNPNRPRTPPPGAVGAVLIAIGLGVAGWFGWAWYQVPRWTEQEIVGSVELNLALDLRRLQADSVPAETQDRMRRQIRQELEQEIAKESEEPRGYTLAGLLIAAFGLVQMIVRTRLARSGA